MAARLLQFVLLAAAYLCAASTLAQAAGLGWLYASGGLTPQKLQQYAAVLYGLDLPSPTDAGSEPAGGDRQEPSDVQLARLVDGHPLVHQRRQTLVLGMAVVDQQQRELQARSQRCLAAKRSLEESLAQLDSEASQLALTEVQQILELVSATQAKELLLRMIADKQTASKETPDDVAQLMKSLSPAKLKKILAEFKTDGERRALHDILVYIGNLAPRGVAENGT